MKTTPPTLHPFHFFFLFSLATAFLSVPLANAQSNTWNGTLAGSWGTATNWTLGTVPTSSNDVFVVGTNYPYIGQSVATAATAGNLTIGSSSGTSRVYLRSAFAGNSLTVANSVVLAPTAGGNGYLYLDNGNFTVGGGTGSITRGAGTSALLVITGNVGALGLSSANVTQLSVGDNGGAGTVGSLTINTGQTYTANTTLVCQNTGTSGTITLNGGTLNAGSLTLSNSNVSNNSTFNLDSGTLTASAIRRGYDASQTFNWNGGTIQNKSGSNLGLSKAGTAAQNLVISLAGTGTHTFQADSTKYIDVQATVTLADKAGEHGTLNKDGAGYLRLYSANTYSGSTTISSGFLFLENSLAMQNSALDTTASVAGDANNGLRAAVTTLTLGGLTGNKNFAATGGVFASGIGNYGIVTALTLNPGTGQTAAYSGAIANGSANMTLTKTGNGTQILAGTNTYTGNTTVSAGTLLINGSTASASALTVQIGGTLGGNGTVGGATTIAGILAPGNSIDTLNIANNTTWAGAATAGATTDWQFELGAGNTADLLNITGNFSKNTAAGSVFRFDFMGSTATGTFKLVDWTGTTDFTLPNEFSYKSDSLAGNTGTFAISGSQLNFTVVPEPATWALLAFSLTTVMVLRRRGVATRV